MKRNKNTKKQRHKKTQMCTIMLNAQKMSLLQNDEQYNICIIYSRKLNLKSLTNLFRFHTLHYKFHEKCTLLTGRSSNEKSSSRIWEPNSRSMLCPFCSYLDWLHWICNEHIPDGRKFGAKVLADNLLTIIVTWVLETLTLV